MDALTEAIREACNAGSQRNGIGVCVCVGFPKGKDLFGGEKGGTAMLEIQ